ncbi:MAG: ABC transporter permease, partial [Gemmatirosa sp.]|nr:ABC transporter permease [Gemmatirosa sp.]
LGSASSSASIVGPPPAATGNRRIAVAIAAMGAVLGTALGYGVAQVVAVVMRRQATIPVHAGFSVSTMLVAVGAPLVVGLCFGMYPALRASRLSPIDAIRHE